MIPLYPRISGYKQQATLRETWLTLQASSQDRLSISDQPVFSPPSDVEGPGNARRAADLVAGSRQGGNLVLPLRNGCPGAARSGRYGVAQTWLSWGRVVRWQLSDGLGLNRRLGAGIMWYAFLPPAGEFGLAA